MSEKANIGLIGLGVMGLNLARNIASKNFTVVVFNRTTSVTEEAIKNFGSEYFIGSKTLEEFVSKIERPRKIILMIQAGDPVDMVIGQLLPIIEKDDIIVDCGNSNYQDTIRRSATLAEQGVEFVGCGISGGEEGALIGPSIMPGGSRQAWKQIAPILKSIAAKDFKGEACTTYVGQNGAGHYVKMVHNGIEYAVMQNIAESYEILRTIHALPANEIAAIFKYFNEGKLNSYLIEITANVLERKDELKEGFLIDYILDVAEQKGTGKWTVIEAFEKGCATPSINSAVIARYISSEKVRRQRMAKIYQISKPISEISLNDFTEVLGEALYASMLISYAQGYDLIQKVAIFHGWQIDLGELSRIWEGGCIIRAKILNTLHHAYSKKENRNLHLFEIHDFQAELRNGVEDLRIVVESAIANSINVHTLTSSLEYFDSITKGHSSANLIQGLRDYFGAHTYQRIDKKGYFHTDWTNNLPNK